MTQTRDMRAKSSQITDSGEIRELLENCGICRLGFSERGTPYVIPINYGYTYENDIISTYYHSSREGRKLDILMDNPLVCFEADRVIRLDPDKNPDRNAVVWESIIGTGIMREVTDFNEKRLMLGNMMKVFIRYNPYYRPTPLTDSRVINILMLKLVLDEYKAKRLYHI